MASPRMGTFLARPVPLTALVWMRPEDGWPVENACCANKEGGGRRADHQMQVRCAAARSYATEAKVEASKGKGQIGQIKTVIGAVVDVQVRPVRPRSDKESETS